MEVNKKRYYINYSICIDKKNLNCTKIPFECIGNNCIDNKSNKNNFIDDKKKFCRSGKCNCFNNQKVSM